MTDEEREVVEKRVLDEKQLYRRQLPDLLSKFPGKWVVFREGGVQAVHDDLDGAYREALRRYGPLGGFVVTQVREERAETIPAIFIDVRR
jgi:hypothetical protein